MTSSFSNSGGASPPPPPPPELTDAYDGRIKIYIFSCSTLRCARKANITFYFLLDLRCFLVKIFNVSYSTVIIQQKKKKTSNFDAK